MPVHIHTRGPVQIRDYEPDRTCQVVHATERQLVERVRVLERGPDIVVEAIHAGYRAGQLQLPSESEREIVTRLFGEVPTRREDRVAFQVVLQAFEDAVLSGDPQRVVAAWRRAFEVYDTLSRDLASLAGLPEQGRGAA